MILNRVLFHAAIAVSLIPNTPAPAGTFVPKFQVIAKSGDPVGGTGETFRGFGPTSLMADARVVAALATYGEPPVLCIWESDHRHVLAKTGDTVSVEGKTWTIGRFDAMRLAPDGNVQFLAALHPAGGRQSKLAFFPNPQHPPFLIEGEPVSGDIAHRFTPDSPEPSAILCEEISGFSANVNETSWLVAGRFSGPGLDGTNGDAILSETGLPLRAGDAAPEFPGETFGDFGMVFHESEPGRAALFTLFPSLTRGIWQVDSLGHPYRRFLLSDSPTNEPAGTTINNPWGPAANWHHTTVFTAMVVRPGESSGRHSVLWVSGEWSELHTLARSGDPAPDGNGAVFLNFESPAPGSNFLGSTDGCRAVFVAKLEGGGVTWSNDEGLYAAGSDGSLHKILREGDLFSVSKNDRRTVAAFTFTPWSMNALDQVSLSIDFADGSSAVVITDLGEIPTSPTPTPTPGPTPENAPVFITFPDGRRILTDRSRITLRGVAKGDVIAVEWRRKSSPRIHKARGTMHWRVPLRLHRSREVVFVRAISGDGDDSRWRKVVVRRR